MDVQASYELFAALLEYPGPDYRERIGHAAEGLRTVAPCAAASLEEFARCTAGLSVETLQELYTQTFDLNPSCALEVGWHLFGESYERGEFLVKMRQQMRRFALTESVELPDHLSHALAVLGRMSAEEADEFASACLFPALDKMRGALEGKNNPFEHVLETTAKLLESRHPRPAREQVPAGPALRVLKERGPQW